MDLDDLSSLLDGGENKIGANPAPKKLGLKPKLKPKPKPKPKTVVQPQPKQQQNNLSKSQQQNLLSLDNKNNLNDTQEAVQTQIINEKLHQIQDQAAIQEPDNQFLKQNGNFMVSQQDQQGRDQNQTAQLQSQTTSQINSQNGMQSQKNLPQQFQNDIINNTLQQENNNNDNVLEQNIEKNLPKGQKSLIDPEKKVRFQENRNKTRKKRADLVSQIQDGADFDDQDAIDVAVEAGEQKRKSKYKRNIQQVNRKRQREEDETQLLNQDVTFLTIRQLIKRAKIIEQQEKSSNEKSAPENNLLLQQQELQVQKQQQQQQLCSQGPQLKFVDGQLVLDEESLEIEAQVVDDISSYKRVRGEDHLLNSHTYMVQDTKQRWTKQDDEKFFEFLGHVGANFDLMKVVFPTRSRNQLLTKYRREWKKNSTRMNQIMSQQGKVQSDNHYKKLVDVLVQESDVIPQLGLSKVLQIQNAQNAENGGAEQLQENGGQNQQNLGQESNDINNQGEGEDDQFQFDFGDNDGEDDQFDMDFD